jgi:DUF1009 family protein
MTTMMAERVEAVSTPPAFRGEGRVAVVAGSGRLPEETAAELARQGYVPFVVVLAGEGADSRFDAYDHIVMRLEDVSGLLGILRSRNVDRVVMAGGVSRRPNPWKMRKNLRLVALLARFIVPLARGDNDLLKAVASYFEGKGIRVLGAHEIVPDLLARPGPMTKARPVSADIADIRAGHEAARTLGALDIGQAAVAIGGRVVALEDIEGTDALLARIGTLRGHGRLAGRKRGVLVKCAKPGQELRADLPTIGLATVEAAHAAGLAGIAVEAGRSFVLQQAETIARADELGLFIVGVGTAEHP